MVAPCTHVATRLSGWSPWDTAGKNPRHPLVRCGGDHIQSRASFKRFTPRSRLMPVPSAPSFLRFEHQAAGRPALGLGAAAPRLSWQVGEAPDGYRQAAYELRGAPAAAPTRSRARGVGGAGPRALAGRAPGVTRERRGPGPRARRGADDWSELERARRRRDGAARARRLDAPASSARPARRAGGRRPPC